jgi:hypothetical protein
MLAQLASRFVVGELGETELGSIGTIEHDEHGAPFALHVWPDETGFDVAAWTRVLGAPTRQARLCPDDPAVWQFLPPNGIVVVEVERDRVATLDAYRFAASSLAGAITTEANLLALVQLVGGSDFTLARAMKLLGNERTRGDWRVELEPRPGSNLSAATIELYKGWPHGLQLTFAQPLDVDFRPLRARFGTEHRAINGNPPAFRTTYTFDAERCRLMLDTYDPMRGARCTIGSALVRQTGAEQATPDSLEVTRPHAWRAPPAPLGPDRVVALIDTIFDGTNPLTLGDPIATGADRTRLRPHDPDLVAMVVRAHGDRITVEVELGEALDPALLEPHLGASWQVPPLHAHGGVAHRFHVRNAMFRGYVLVAPKRITLHRAPADAWIGDFARPEDVVLFVQRFLDDPDLSPEAVLALAGDPGQQLEFDDDQRSVKLIPFAGSNAREIAIYFHAARRRVTRIELGLHAPRAVDLREIRLDQAFSGPSPSLLAMQIIQYAGHGAHGRALLNMADQRSGPIQLVTSLIVDRD